MLKIRNSNWFVIYCRPYPLWCIQKQNKYFLYAWALDRQFCLLYISFISVKEAEAGKWYVTS